MYTTEAIVANPLGIHARPATRLVTIATNFQADILIETKDGMKVDAKSILDILCLALSYGHPVKIKAEGPDEVAAAQALAECLEKNVE